MAAARHPKAAAGPAAGVDASGRSATATRGGGEIGRPIHLMVFRHRREGRPPGHLHSNDRPAPAATPARRRYPAESWTDRSTLPSGRRPPGPMQRESDFSSHLRRLGGKFHFTRVRSGHAGSVRRGEDRSAGRPARRRRPGLPGPSRRRLLMARPSAGPPEGAMHDTARSSTQPLVPSSSRRVGAYPNHYSPVVPLATSERSVRRFPGV